MKTNHRLQEVSDVGVVAPQVGDSLVFNGKAWQNRSSINPGNSGSFNTFFAPQKLLVYYGYPIAFQNLWDAQEIITRISKWDIWVCGAGYENPNDSNYATTTQIIAGVRALGVKVYGYVTVGGPPLATLAQIQQNVTWWANIGVDGIFFDSAGFDFTGVTRELQIGAKQAARSYLLPVAWNAYYFEHVAADNITQVTWPSSSSRYTEFQTANPNNLVLPRDTGDVYVFEDFGCDTNGVYAADPSNSNMDDLQFHQKAMQVVWAQPQTIFGQSPTPPNPPLALYEVWAIVTLPATDNTGQSPNFSILGNLQTLQELVEYFWACVYLYVNTGKLTAPYITAVCISGSNYGSWGYSLETPRMLLADVLLGGFVLDSIPSADYSHHTFTRQIGPQATLEVVTNLALPPNPPALSATSGNLPAGTYYYKITRSSSYGETLPSTEVSITLTATGGVLVDWGNTSASGWEKSFTVYGRASGSEGYLQNVEVVNATNWTDNGSVTPTGSVPTQNTAYEFVPRFSNLFFTGITQATEAQGGYALVGGNPNQAFEVGTASSQSDALPLGQAQSDFAPKGGSPTETFEAADATAGTQEVLPISQGDTRYAAIGGNASQVFQAANSGSGTQQVVPRAQADTLYVPQTDLPLSVANGGTGANAAAGALSNLGGISNAGSLSTASPVSGTIYQNTTAQPVTILMPVTYNPTASAAATMTPALGSTSAPGSLPAESEPATSVAGKARSFCLRVPAGWYYSFTAVNATLGTAQIIQG